MSHMVVVTAVGQDRPGIIAALSGGLYSLGASLDDATMTRLHGAFATMLAARLPEGRTDTDVRDLLTPIAGAHGLTLAVQVVPDDRPATEQADHLLTVYGADRPGIVYRVSEQLSKHGVNITDMDTRVTGSPNSPVYVMLLEIHAGDEDLKSDLDSLKTELGVDIALQTLDAEAL